MQIQICTRGFRVDTVLSASVFCRIYISVAGTLQSYLLTYIDKSLQSMLIEMSCKKSTLLVAFRPVDSFYFIANSYPFLYTPNHPSISSHIYVTVNLFYAPIFFFFFSFENLSIGNLI